MDKLEKSIASITPQSIAPDTTLINIAALTWLKWLFYNPFVMHTAFYKLWE
jgi:hypothetical protein